MDVNNCSLLIVAVQPLQGTNISVYLIFIVSAAYIHFKDLSLYFFSLSHFSLDVPSDPAHSELNVLRSDEQEFLQHPDLSSHSISIVVVQKSVKSTSLLAAETILMTGRSLTVSRPVSLLMTRLLPPTVFTTPAWLWSSLANTTWLATTCLWKTGSWLRGSSPPLTMLRSQTVSETVSTVTGPSSLLNNPAASNPSQARKTPVTPSSAPACLGRKYLRNICEIL